MVCTTLVPRSWRLIGRSAREFPQLFVDEVRSAADIVTVISDYVSLPKAGTSYKGLCPFHAEKPAIADSLTDSSPLRR